jgi:hypothetical protein
VEGRALVGEGLGGVEMGEWTSKREDHVR